MSKPADRRNVTQPPDWWDAFAAAAQESGATLSEWIGDTCRKALPKAVRGTLSTRVGRGKPPANRADV